MTARIAEKHFDREATVYPVDIGKAHTQFLKWKLMDSFTAPDQLVVDIGAASGRHAIPVIQKGCDVLALDLSPEMLRKLKANSDGRSLKGRAFTVVAQLPDLPLGEACFDVAYSYATLLLLPQNEQEEAIKQIARSLKPDGIGIFDLANRYCLAIRYWDRYYRRLGMRGIFGHSYGNLPALLKRCGLEMVAIHPQGAVSQFLLAPGISKSDWVRDKVSGNGDHPGIDDYVSRAFPRLAERWYIVVRRKAD